MGHIPGYIRSRNFTLIMKNKNSMVTRATDDEVQRRLAIINKKNTTKYRIFDSDNNIKLGTGFMTDQIYLSNESKLMYESLVQLMLNWKNDDGLIINTNINFQAIFERERPFNLKSLIIACDVLYESTLLGNYNLSIIKSGAQQYDYFCLNNKKKKEKKFQTKMDYTLNDWFAEFILYMRKDFNVGDQIIFNEFCFEGKKAFEKSTITYLNKYIKKNIEYHEISIPFDLNKKEERSIVMTCYNNYRIKSFKIGPYIALEDIGNRSDIFVN